MDVFYIGPENTFTTTQQGVETNKRNALGHLKRILGETRGSIYKIGIATNPTGRSYGHNRVAVDERREGDLIYVTYQVGLWARMFVIFQSPSAVIIRDAEREFIQAANQGFGDFSKSNIVTMNTSTGGEGPLGAKGPYFLYVLRSGA
jgi:hypothetical protein